MSGGEAPFQPAAPRIIDLHSVAVAHPHCCALLPHSSELAGRMTGGRHFALQCTMQLSQRACSLSLRVVNGEISTMTDLSSQPLFTDVVHPADLDRVADLIRGSERLVVFTGAGISTESGIPDYRGPNGVWAKQTIPHIDTMRTDDEARIENWQRWRKHYPELLAREPNAGHLAIAELESLGYLLAVVTQNIDGLHQKAGNHPERVIELHGSSHVLRCLDCGRRWDGQEIFRRLEEGDLDPRCEFCGGPLRTGTILFGEPLPEQALRTAFAVSKATDLMIVIGTSLVVNPAARLPVLAKESGARLVIINQSQTPLDELADVRISAGAGNVLSRVLDQVREDGVRDYG